MSREFVAAGLRVAVDSEESRDLEAVFAAWAPAASLTPAHADSLPKLRYVLKRGGEVLRDGAAVETELLDDSVAIFERDLLNQIVDRSRHLTLLHAAGLVFPLSKKLIFLVGKSGAGKSTMTRQALRAESGGDSPLGAPRYLSDDLLLLGPSTVTGAPRSVQFDSVRSGQIPSYHHDCDCRSYLVQRRGHEHCVPLYYRGVEAVAEVPLETFEVCLVSLARGKQNAVAPMNTLDRIARLHAASLQSGEQYPGQVDAGRSFQLTWKEPDAAWRLLSEQLSAG